MDIARPPQGPDFSKFVGKKLGTEVTEDEIKQYASASEVRVLYPNSPMTMDLRHDRVNIMVEMDKTIQMINMG